MSNAKKIDAVVGTIIAIALNQAAERWLAKMKKRFRKKERSEISLRYGIPMDLLKPR